jgi:HNH endonuclease/Helix-turn-helix domain of resolvase
MAAHRVAWEIHNGYEPVGMLVLHKCDVPLCVNPEHLELGDHAKNMADRASRGRNRSGRDKLSVEQIRKIRILRKQGRTFSSLAKEFGVTKSTVYRATSLNSWKDV